MLSARLSDRPSAVLKRIDRVIKLIDAADPKELANPGCGSEQVGGKIVYCPLLLAAHTLDASVDTTSGAITVLRDRVSRFVIWGEVWRLYDRHTTRESGKKNVVFFLRRERARAKEILEAAE